MKKREIPRFESETQEAEWWYRQRDRTARWMEEAVAAGETTTLPKVLERSRTRALPRPAVSMRIDPLDVARARALAARRGLPYETYLRKLLRQALDREEKAIAR